MAGRIRPKISRRSEWNQIKSKHGIGTRVEATVTDRVGLGVLCIVGGKRIPAVCRNREIDWDPANQGNDFLPLQSFFEAEVIDHDDDWRQLVLSRKAATPAPFEQYVERHPPGSIVAGTIFKLFPHKIQVRLEGGVEGSIDREDLPDIPEHKEMTCKWELKHGDHIRAAIVDANTKSRCIRLSISRALKEVERQNREWVQHQRRRERKNLSAPLFSTPVRLNGPVASEELVERSLRVLIVEDQLEIANPVSEMLRERAHRTSTAATFEDACLAIDAADSLDVAILDLLLQDESGMPLLSHIHERFPECQIIVMTGNVGLLPAHWRDVAKVLNKPVPPDQIIATVEAHSTLTSQERRFQLDEDMTTFTTKDHQEVQKMSSISRQVFDQYLQSIGEIVPKAGIALLSYSQDVNAIRCLRSWQLDVRMFEKQAWSLPQSWIGDALVNHHCRQIVVDGDTSTMDSFAHLLRALRCRYALGVPLDIESQPNPCGIFVFLPSDEDLLGDSRGREIRHLTAALALAIDRAVLDAELVRSQRAMSVGGLLLGMTHEFRNSVQSMMLNVEKLNRSLNSVQDDVQEGSRQSLALIRRQLETLSGSFESMLGLARPQSQRYEPIRDILDKVVDECFSAAEHDNIVLSWKNYTSSEISSTPVSTALYQVFMNLIMNGIQHTRAFRTQNAFVKMTLRDEDVDGRKWAVVRVEDNAFGLDWERHNQVFEMMHTTRRDGSGLGLYVADLIVRSLNGTLSVESSYKYMGSTFKVRFPANKPMKRKAK